MKKTLRGVVDFGNSLHQYGAIRGHAAPWGFRAVQTFLVDETRKPRHKRQGVPMDVANLVLFVACDGSAFMSGVNGDINGGMLFSQRGRVAPARARFSGVCLKKIVAARGSAAKQEGGRVMRETWRWFGPLDALPLSEIAQTGAAGIVTALHEVPYGEVWDHDAIAARNAQIAAAGFTWDVVESLPIHERIKRGEGDLSPLFANYRQSMANLAANGVRTICYNFMPLLDWTRTDLAAPLARGGTCLRFEAAKMAAFEVFMVKRAGAEAAYGPSVMETATAWFNAASEDDQAQLLNAIMSGLPGAYDRYDIATLRSALAAYDGLAHDDLRANLKRFLQEIIPTAQELGMSFCIHPDDPPRDILGLPRIVSDAHDIAHVYAAYDAPENGLTLCTGSLGGNRANDLPQIARQFGDRIHFAHLRNVAKDPDGSFEEAPHLAGDTDMVAVIAELLAVEARRDTSLPFRPDHGHDLLSDADRNTHPGYPMIGRLRGLAELRGVIAGLRGAAYRA